MTTIKLQLVYSKIIFYHRGFIQKLVSTLRQWAGNTIILLQLEHSRKKICMMSIRFRRPPKFTENEVNIACLRQHRVIFNNTLIQSFNSVLTSVIKRSGAVYEIDATFFDAHVRSVHQFNIVCKCGTKRIVSYPPQFVFLCNGVIPVQIKVSGVGSISPPGERVPDRGIITFVIVLI